MAKFKVIILSLLVLISTAIAALAAGAAAPEAQNTPWSSVDFIKALASGALGSLLTSLLAWFTLRQRQHEFEIQTKMQIESLHSDEKKKVCNDFLSSVNPHLFAHDEFDFGKMNFFITQLYIYSTENHFSYFENVTHFILKNEMVDFGKNYTEIFAEINSLRHQCESNKDAIDEGWGDEGELQQEVKRLSQRIKEREPRLWAYEDLLKKYTTHHDLAVKAAKKLIWNEPIEKAQPLQLEDLPDEDNI